MPKFWYSHVVYSPKVARINAMDGKMSREKRRRVKNYKAIKVIYDRGYWLSPFHFIAIQLWNDS